MPHKRAKRSVRDQSRSNQGHDQAPSANRAVGSEGVSKGISRVLDGARIRDEYHKRKAAGLNGADDGPVPKKRKGAATASGTTQDATAGKKRKETKASADVRIRPGESLAHFNRRVEDSMRPLVRSAMSTASSHVRRTTKGDPADIEKKGHVAPSTQSKGKRPASDLDNSDAEEVPSKKRATDFETTSSSAPRRLNDIAQAPPSFARLPKERGTAAAIARLKGEKTGTPKADGVVSMAQRARMEEERERAVRRYREMKAAKMWKDGRGA